MRAEKSYRWCNLVGVGVMEPRFLVSKFDGRTEPFNSEKLRASIEKALRFAGLADYIDEVVNDVLSGLDTKRQVISTSEIADRVEKAFIERIVINDKFELAARAYLLARIYNHVYGKGNWSEISSEDLALTYSALRVLVSRYLVKDPGTLRLRETPSRLFWRVAKHIASAEHLDRREYWAKRFYDLMVSLRFLPNSPTLMNAGSKLGILSACFVIPVRDAIVTEEEEGIYDALRAQALVFQQGGGCGFDFSELRPEGDVVASTAGVASGPLSFIRVFDTNTEVIKQGGRRRGANMGVLHIWHPDIEKFVLSKSGKLKDVNLQNFNISVGVYDYFMESVIKGGKIPLINPRKASLIKANDSRYYAMVRARHYMNEDWVQEVILKELEEWGWSVPLDKSLIVTVDEALQIAESEGAIARWVDSGELFDSIVKSAWESGDPGLLFIDSINRRHPVWYLGKINSTNPCVSGDTRILTPRGWKTIREIFEEARHGGRPIAVAADGGVLGEGGEPLAYPAEILAPVVGGDVYRGKRDEDLGSLGVAPINAWIWHVGKKSGVRVITEEGFELTVTPEHLLLTPEGWKPAKELKPGDRIAIARLCQPLTGLGEDVDSDIAFALGWLVGSGILNRQYIAWYFGPESREAMERVRRAIEKLGGIVYIPAVCSNTSCKIQLDSDTEIYRKIVAIIREQPLNREEVSLPEIVWRMSNTSLISFLRGLFTSSSLVSTNKTVRLVCTSLRLLKEIQILLLNLGIISSIREIPQIEESRQNIESNKEESCARCGYYELLIEGSSKALYEELIGYGPEEESVIRTSRNIEDRSWAVVKSIDHVGEVDFYDLTVPGISAYVANGIISHNCGEQPLLEWESCNLGSINLEKYVVGGPDGRPTIDWRTLAEDIGTAVRFLDNVISVAKYPLKQLQIAVERTRKVGLGVMGWAHMLINLGIRYDSPDALYLAYHLAEFIAYNAYMASIELAKERGSFPEWNPSLYRPLWQTTMSIEELFDRAGVNLSEVSDRVKELVRSRPPVDWAQVESAMLSHGLRNATLLSIAPTGTLSIIAGTSSSIEPIFALAFTRVVTVGTFIEVNRLFLEMLRRYELDDQEVVKLVAESGTIAHNPYFPRKLRELFRTAHDVPPKYHVCHQAVWQQWVDAGVSKTVNMVYEATPADIVETYILAWKLGCKGITVYRDKSKSKQVIYFGVKISEKTAGERKEILGEEKVEAKPDKFRASAYVLKEGETGGCPTCEY